jgi:hypothetical protein
MGHCKGRAAATFVLTAAVALAAGRAGAAQVTITSIAAGVNYEYLSRTVVWHGDTAASRLQANLFTARADFRLAGDILVSLSAGVASTDNGVLDFTTLPISLRYDGTRFGGFSMGADAVFPVAEFSIFEIGGTGRFVYSFGSRRTWPLEGFAVEGQAAGRSTWLEGAVGPRISTRALSGIVPYLEICLRWLHAGFEMTETLGDLSGAATKRVDDISFSVALGADATLTERFDVKARAGLVPYSGGVDGLVSIGLLYKF